MARQGKEGLRTVTFPQTIKKIIITVTVIFTIITNKFSTSDQLSCTARSPTKPRSSDALDSVKDSTEILNYLTDPAPPPNPAKHNLWWNAKSQLMYWQLQDTQGREWSHCSQHYKLHHQWGYHRLRVPIRKTSVGVWGHRLLDARIYMYNVLSFSLVFPYLSLFHS